MSIRKTISKILIILTTLALSMLIGTGTVNAKYLGLGKEWTTGAGVGGAGANMAECVDGRDDTFCVVNGRALSFGKYKVTNYIRIEGNQSQVFNGNTNAESAKLGTYNTEANGTMAWILAQADTGSRPYESVYSQKQRAVYAYFTTWKNENGLSSFYSYGKPGNMNWAWVTEGQNYAKGVGNATSQTVAYAKDNTAGITEKMPEHIDGTEMIRFGPYNVDFLDKIEYLRVYNQDGVELASTKFAKYEGKELKVSNDPNEIVRSNENFYILVPGDGSVTDISSIKMGVFYDQHIYNANIWTLTRLDATVQNLITTSSDVSENRTTAEVDLITTSLVTPTPYTPHVDSPTPDTPTPDTPTPDSPTPDSPTPDIPSETPYTPDSDPTPPPPPVKTQLHVIKVNEQDTSIRLKGVSFVFQKESTGKYLKLLDNGETDFVDSKEEASVFKTDENGEIIINNVLVGDYIAYEVANERYGYESKAEGVKIVVEENEGVIRINQISNKQIYIKLSGYVWEDMLCDDKKGGVRNDLFQDNSYDENDTLMPGVIVRLKSRSTGETIKETVTDENGAYLFTEVEIEKLDDYYIEFEYNGLKYKDVIPHIELDNGSKATESEEKRNKFNEDFNYVEGKDANENTGSSLNANREETHGLSYTRGEGEDLNKSFLNGYDENGEGNQFPITANTDNANFNVKDKFSYGVEEIPFINLGLYEREQADLALMKDIQNAIVSVNGYTHVYNYKNRIDNAGEDGGAYGVGVKFVDKLTYTYSRPVYKADVTYRDADESKELKMAITYRLRFVNQSTNLKARVNSIADYYDAKYGTNYTVGTGINRETGEVTGTENVTVEQSSFNEQFNKLQINLSSDMLIEPGTSTFEPTDEQEDADAENIKVKGGDVFVQFKLSREEVAKIVEDNKNPEPQAPLDNDAEITSYTSFDSAGNLYAAIDIDSAPGNYVKGNDDTLEDDSDYAPSFIIKYANPDNRKMTGNVFEDLADGTFTETAITDATAATPAPAPRNTEGGTGNERLGNGRFDSGERGVQGVNVRLIELNDDFTINGTTENPVIAKEFLSLSDPTDTADITAVSGDNGEYELHGFVPGKYAIQFIWGGTTLTKIVGDPSDPNSEDRVISAEDYKATTMPEEEWNRKISNPLWYQEYKEDLTKDPRYTDAKDDPAIREQIDEPMKHQVWENSTGEQTGTIDMISTTAPMEVKVEFHEVENSDVNITTNEEGTEVESQEDTFSPYNIGHIDFGIIERPRQSMKLDKYIDRIRLVLQNNIALTDVRIERNADGSFKELKGEIRALTYLEPNETLAEGDTGRYGTIRLEVDDEIMQDAKVEVTYIIKAINASEMDYYDTEYYDYGKIVNADHVRTMAAPEVVDYLDGTYGYKTETNPEWKLITKDDLTSQKIEVDTDTGELATASSVNTEEHKTVTIHAGNTNYGKLENKFILTTEVNEQLKPGESKEKNLLVSKDIGADSDIELGNEAEVAHIYKEHGGRRVDTVPGSFITGFEEEKAYGSVGTNSNAATEPEENGEVITPQEIAEVYEASTSVMPIMARDNDKAETVIVTPPSGKTTPDYTKYAIIGVSSLAVLAAGIIIIRKRILKS